MACLPLRPGGSPSKRRFHWWSWSVPVSNAVRRGFKGGRGHDTLYTVAYVPSPVPGLVNGTIIEIKDGVHTQFL